MVRVGGLKPNADTNSRDVRRGANAATTVRRRSRHAASSTIRENSEPALKPISVRPDARLDVHQPSVRLLVSSAPSATVEEAVDWWPGSYVTIPINPVATTGAGSRARRRTDSPFFSPEPRPPLQQEENEPPAASATAASVPATKISSRLNAARRSLQQTEPGTQPVGFLFRSGGTRANAAENTMITSTHYGLKRSGRRHDHGSRRPHSLGKRGRCKACAPRLSALDGGASGTSGRDVEGRKRASREQNAAGSQKWRPERHAELCRTIQEMHRLSQFKPHLLGSIHKRLTAWAAAAGCSADRILSLLQESKMAEDELRKDLEPLAWKVVHRTNRKGQMDNADLFLETMRIVPELARKWKPGYGARFTTFAQRCMWLHVNRVVATESQLLYLPDNYRELTKAIRRAREELSGNEPSVEQIATHLGIPQHRVEDALQLLNRRQVSMDGIASGDDSRDDATLQETLGDSEESSTPVEDEVLGSLQQGEIAAELDAYIEMLDVKQAWVLRARYGLGVEQLTLREAAHEVGYSHPFQAQVLERRALAKLQRLASRQLQHLVPETAR